MLEQHAEGDPLALLLRRLELERQWMGEVLVLDVHEWINKSSGRDTFDWLSSIATASGLYAIGHSRYPGDPSRAEEQLVGNNA